MNGNVTTMKYHVEKKIVAFHPHGNVTANLNVQTVLMKLIAPVPKINLTVRQATNAFQLHGYVMAKKTVNMEKMK